MNSVPLYITMVYNQTPFVGKVTLIIVIFCTQITQQQQSCKQYPHGYLLHITSYFPFPVTAFPSLHSVLCSAITREPAPSSGSFLSGLSTWLHTPLLSTVNVLGDCCLSCLTKINTHSAHLRMHVGTRNTFITH